MSRDPSVQHMDHISDVPYVELDNTDTSSIQQDEVSIGDCEQAFAEKSPYGDEVICSSESSHDSSIDHLLDECTVSQDAEEGMSGYRSTSDQVAAECIDKIGLGGPQSSSNTESQSEFNLSHFISCDDANHEESQPTEATLRWRERDGIESSPDKNCVSPTSFENEEPSELKHFPSNNFGSTRRNSSSGVFPAPNNSEEDMYGYGSISTNNTGNGSDDSLRLLPPPSPSTHSYEFDDASSSERTPILSNHANGSNHKLMLPPSIKTLEDQDEVSKENLKSALRNSPTRNALLLSSGARPESIRKVLHRQRSISKMIGDHVGKKQPTSCRDVPFAIFYLSQLIVVLCVGLRFGPDAWKGPVGEDASEEGIQFTYTNILLTILASGLVSMAVSVAALSAMTVFTKYLVHMALVLAVLLSMIWTVVGLVNSPQNFVPLTGLFALGISVAYMFTVWDKIPFVSANLFTALMATRSTFAILGLMGVMQIFALLWIIIYFFTIIGVYSCFQDTHSIETKWRVATYIGLGVSFHWTIQALIYTTQVCIAGYINRWWLNSRMTSSEKLDAVGESLVRALVFSFGSVCFGSLFIRPVNVMKSVADHLRPNSEEAPMRALVAVQEAIVSCIDYFVAMFHDFGMVYVGMYGYGFLEAAKRSNSLLQKRGWQDIVGHHLLNNLLLIVSLVIAGLSGCISVEIVSAQHLSLVSSGSPTMISFCIGFFVGFVLSSILFCSVSSSVNAVVICFAGNPVEFQTNHPECSQIMREAWRESWPGFVDFVEKEGALTATRSPGHLLFRRDNLEPLFT